MGLGRRGGLPGNRAGHGIQTLFEHGDARIQPVAVAVERIDGGSQPANLVGALLGEGLQPLGLPRQVGGGDLLAAQRQLRLVGEHGQHDRGDRRGAPGADPPQRAAVERILFGQQPAQCPTGILDLETAGLLVPIPCHTNAFGHLRPTQIMWQTLTGNAPTS